jgi:DNA-binding GntR family transcriptional regulator
MVEWTGEKSAYRQVADDLCRRISAGEFKDRGTLPSLATLQTEYGVTATVARSAVTHLRTAGLVVSHQGKGAFLTDDAQARAAALAPSEELGHLRREVAEVRSELQALRERVAALEGK